MKNFFKDRIAELHNITWPTKAQAIHAMVLVVVIMLLVGVSLGIIDYFLNQAVLQFLK
ncbi:MAG: preprotein translocase subunit SecE [Candidatus Peregrinibacteria bacterium]|nr:preprotein translocase subunit SecE [Candidatus Peregrinibacteria bacterium]